MSSQPAAVQVGPAEENLRQRCGILAGTVGIVVNTAIFLTEIFVGLATSSIAISADAFHNLTDVVSSVITIVSFRLARKPADKEHPFGHGRIEYLATLIVAFIVMLIGYQFLQSSIQKVLHPSGVRFSVLSLVLILAAIPLKIALSLFNRHLGRRINSSTLRATSIDALSDVFILSVASVSLIVAAFSPVHVDGWLGIAVALFIMYSGFLIARDALNPLLGQPPDPAIVHAVVEETLAYPYITGVHDLVMHNYGPGKFMASIHAEVPCDVPVMQLHESIDAAEKELSLKYGILLVIHMDPLNKDDSEVREARQALLEAIRPLEEVSSIHDFRIVGQGDCKNLIFDAVVGSDTIRTPRDEEALRGRISEALHRSRPHYNAIVSFDRNYLPL